MIAPNFETWLQTCISVYVHFSKARHFMRWTCCTCAYQLCLLKKWKNRGVVIFLSINNHIQASVPFWLKLLLSCCVVKRSVNLGFYYTSLVLVLLIINYRHSHVLFCKCTNIWATRRGTSKILVARIGFNPLAPFPNPMHLGWGVWAPTNATWLQRNSNKVLNNAKLKSL